MQSIAATMHSTTVFIIACRAGRYSVDSRIPIKDIELRRKFWTWTDANSSPFILLENHRVQLPFYHELARGEECEDREKPGQCGPRRIAGRAIVGQRGQRRRIVKRFRLTNGGREHLRAGVARVKRFEAKSPRHFLEEFTLLSREFEFKL